MAIQYFARCPVRRTLRPVQVTDQGKIKRVRGVAWAVRVSPSVVNRMVEVAKVRFTVTCSSGLFGY